MAKTLAYIAGCRRVCDSPEWWQPVIWKSLDGGEKVMVWESPGVFFSNRDKAAASAADYLAASILNAATKIEVKR